MYSEYMLMKLDQDRRDACVKRGARERMLQSIRASKPGIKCQVCGKLAAFFLKAGKQLLEMAQINPVEGIPAMKSEDLRRMLERPASKGLFV